MQFKGSVRAPGDRDPGVRVVLDIDEYHLEIRRDAELFGRYYLADVEVARDIAERFILFLGDDEVEFLADDALQFAYGGVTAMQDAWLEAQKKKRRHRRAAEASARRKDDEPRSVDLETPVAAQPLHVSESDAVRRRRLESGAPTRPIPSPGRQAPASKATYSRATGSPTPAPNNGNVSRKRPEAAPEIIEPDIIEPVKESTSRRKAPPMPPLPDPATFEDIIEDDLFIEEAILDHPILDDTELDDTELDGPILDDPELDETVLDRPVAAQPIEMEYFDETDEVEDTSLAARRRKITARAKAEPTPNAKRGAKAKAAAKPEAIPEPPPEAPPNVQRKQPKESDLGRVRVPEPASARSAQPAPDGESNDLEEPTGRTDATAGLETAGQVRFAQDGHHPFETSTGLLAKLRGQPRRPSNHVHRFKESGSSVGLVRRVCTECAYVSIGSDD